MLTTIEKVLFLKSVDFFKEIPGESLVHVAHISKEENYFDNDIVITQGEIGSHMYIIVKGEVKVLVGDSNVARLKSKDCVGEMSLLDSEPRSASVVADGDVTLLKIEQEEFYNLLYEQKEIVQGVVGLLTRRLRDANREWQKVES